METSPLPLTSQLIPVANGNFNYTGLTVPLTFNSQLPTGPNPNNTEIPLGIPFPFVRITYSPSGAQPARFCSPTPVPACQAMLLQLAVPADHAALCMNHCAGFPTNGNTPSFVGVYTTPMWAIR